MELDTSPGSVYFSNFRTVGLSPVLDWILFSECCTEPENRT